MPSWENILSAFHWWLRKCGDINSIYKIWCAQITIKGPASGDNFVNRPRRLVSNGYCKGCKSNLQHTPCFKHSSRLLNKPEALKPKQVQEQQCKGTGKTTKAKTATAGWLRQLRKPKSSRSPISSCAYRLLASVSLKCHGCLWLTTIPCQELMT